MPNLCRSLHSATRDLARGRCGRRAGGERRQAATSVVSRPLRVVEVAPRISTATRSPGAAEPLKFTVVLRRDPAGVTVGTARALDEHLLDAPDPRGVSRGGDALHHVDEPLHAVALHVLGHLVVQLGGLRSRRGEYTNVNALSKPTSSTTSSVSWNSSSVSPGIRR